MKHRIFHDRHFVRKIRLVAVMVLPTLAVVLPGCGSEEEQSATTVVETTTTQEPPATSPPTEAPTTSPPPTEVPTTTVPTTLAAASADPLMPQQWAVAQLRLPEIWGRGVRGEGAVIAVVDTGVDLDHPDLVDQLVPGIDIVDGDDDPQDTNGHGTHVAGIAAAATGNGIGVAGTAPDAKIMPVRVLGTDGTGTDEGIAEGINWAVANGADVVNLSLGETGVLSRISKGGPLNTAIKSAAAQGVVVIAAAGNEGTVKRNYRAGTPTLVVNATNPAGQLAQFSNSGDLRSVAAPGVQILSTAPTEPTSLWPSGSRGYELLDGTSMATPLVSGIAAMLLSTGVPASTVIERIVTTADGASNPQLGAGVVDPSEAVG